MRKVLVVFLTVLVVLITLSLCGAIAVGVGSIVNDIGFVDQIKLWLL